MTDIPQCHTQKYRIARKEHKCCECQKLIVVGEKYSYSSGVWDGDPQSFKQCENCYIIASRVATYCATSKWGEELPAYEQLSEWFFNSMCRDYKGRKFLEGEAENIGVSAENLNKLLKINLDELD